MTQLTDVRMNGEEEEKKTEKIKKDRRKRSGSTKTDDAKRPDVTKADDGSPLAKKDGGESKDGKTFGGSSPVADVEANIPLVRIQQATPSPRPLDQSEGADEAKEKKRKRRKKSKRREKTDEAEEGLDEEDESASDENEEDEEEDEDVEEEEEEEESEMTQEEKKAMYEAVIEGDIDALEDCLDLPNSDINMIWFQENLLMAAIRAGHVDVAEFLLDNGVDSTFSTSVVDVQETAEGKVMERYEVDCRQMAYDRHLQDIVFLIDFLQDNLFPFIPRPVRTPRLRRPKPQPSDIEDTEEDEEDDDDDDEDDADDESQSGGSDVSDSLSDLVRKKENGGGNTPLSEGNQETTKTTTKKKKKKKKREQRRKQSRVNSAVDADDAMIADNNTYNNDDDDDGKRTATADEEDGDKDKTFRTGSTCGDVDSGNYSMASSKLKKSMLQKHDKLLEKEERSRSNSADSPRKSESESTPTKSQSQKTKGDRTDRTSTTFTQDRVQSSCEPDESRTASRSLVPEVPEWAAVLNPPSNRIRSTKAAVATKQGNLSRNFYKSPLHASTTERPLKWRKVSTIGSYARESRRWHLENKIDETDDEKVRISQLRITPLFPPSSSSSAPNSILSSSASFCSKSAKSQRLSTTPSDVSESISISGLSIQDRVDRFKTAAKSTSKRSSPLLESSGPSEVASYMRPTQSTMTKQRLGTQFVDSYGGLGFCPNPSRSTNFHMGMMMRSPGKLQINGTAAAGGGALSRSHRVPVLTGKSVVQRRNENVISYRT